MVLSDRRESIVNGNNSVFGARSASKGINANPC